ncbi:hypothetical protein [Aquimarina pacifica]|uniref:hypothetical protein n=1 Tax=Aquimarina pacifica TaxID=1296415 RepID=UPI0004B5A5BD
MKNNIFSEDTVQAIISRINHLTPDTQAEWGKMNVGQMLAHCNVTYEMVYDNIHPKPNGFVKFMLKAFVKGKVVSDKPYAKNGRTAPQFVVTSSKDFEV